MYLKEIIINGFKSFADKTKVTLGPGVTTIVGPNGCGKSNVVDALRWVLGEQSAKQLRGGKMQDVIFAGTDSRQQLPECEVTLVFTDCELALGTAFNEVEISRKVTRDGGSNYSLNGKSCRLKDIQQLFMDTGIGRVSYSFMVQGQIDQILSTNPAERRVIFEEAAGITKYKSQRKETLNKLAQVDQNLSRATDVIDEVGRQMGSLKRQASKAIRYQKVKHRLTHLDLASSGYRYGQRHGEIEDVEIKAEKLRSEVLQMQRDLEGDELGLEDKRQERTLVYEKLQAVQQETFDIRSQKDTLERQSELSGIRKKDAEARILCVEAEIESLKQQVIELEGKAKDDSQVRQMQLDLVSGADSAYKEKSEAVEITQKNLAEAEKEFQQKRSSLVQLESGIARLQSRCSSLEVALKTDEAKVQDLKEKSQETEELEAELKTRLEKAKETFERREEELKRAQQELEEEQGKVAQVRDSFREAQKQIQEQDRELARVQAQLSILEGLQAKLEGFSEGAKAILQGKLACVAQGEPVGALTKSLDVDEKYTEALEVLLGQAIDAIAVDEVSQVSAITRELAERNLGRACLNVCVPERSIFSKSGVKLPEGMVEAGDVVRSENKATSERLAHLLQGCYFCEHLDEFIDFWQGQPEFEFLFIATSEGELVDARGLVYGGSRKKGAKGASFIKRESEIRTLAEKLDEEKKKLEKFKSSGEEAQRKLAETEETIEQKRKRVQEINQGVSEGRIEVREAQNSWDRLVDQRERGKIQLETLNRSHEDAQRRLTEGQAELAEEVEKIESIKNAVNGQEDEITRLREERDNAREALSEVRIDLSEKRQRLDMLAQGLSKMDEQLGGIEASRVKLEREVDQLKDQISQWEREGEESRIQAEELAVQLEEKTTSLGTEKEKAVGLEEAIQEVEKNLNVRRKDLHDKESSLKGYEVKLVQERSQVEFLMEKMQTEYEIELKDIDWKMELWHADEEFESRVKLDELEEGEELVAAKKEDRGDPTEEDLAAMESTDWKAIESEIKQLRDRISGMGAVNLVAIEEYSELKERFEFLQKQCNDLASAKDQLVVAIDEINKTSEELFKETFEQVKINFKGTFNKLFGGGEADLSLMEAEDILEAGIEIVARPPGTKLKGLSLLSGGQKTMTAVALLFAIYQVKPSPFCVLDELDAPLDDANIGRFTTMLREFTKYSQFLVISHNKRTISASDRLYGVTMQERGVTKLISMKFNRNEGKVEETSSEKVSSEKEEILEGQVA